MSQATVYTAEQKTEALRLYAEVGPSEASRRTGVKRSTISEWARRTKVVTDVMTHPAAAMTATQVRRARVEAAVEQNRLTMEEKRLQLANDLLDDAQRLRRQLWGSATVHHWGSESAGKGETAGTVFMEHQIDEPTFGDKRSILQAVGVAVDKSQLLAGEATERTGSVDAETALERIRELRKRALHIVDGEAAAS